MDTRQKVLAVVCSVALMITIIELVRRRKLKEEYSWLWLLAGVTILVIGLNYGVLLWITKFVGAGFTSSTLFFFGLFFLLALALQFSVKISSLETQLKNLAQKVALQNAQEPSDESKHQDKG